MSGALDAKGRAVALKQIAKFGRSATLTIMGAETYNDTTLTNSRASSSFPVPALLTKASVRDPDGRLVRLQEDVVLVPASALPAGVRPTKGDQITLNGAPREIEEVDAVEPGVLPILYRLKVAR